MSVLRNLESKIADLVEGTFGRVFRTQVRPVEIARKLAREMDEHKTVSVSRTYVPNEYVVWLSRRGPRALRGRRARGRRRAGRLPARARPARAPRARVAPADRVPHRRAPAARRVRHPGPARAPERRAGGVGVEQADHGHTMVYSTAARKQEELSEHPSRAARPARPRGRGQAHGRRPARRGHRPQPRVRRRPGRRQRLAPPRRDPARPPAAGRSPTSARPTACRSTAGRCTAPIAVAPGDRIELGTVDVRFEVL